MIFWLLSLLTSSQLPSIPPFPRAPGAWEGRGNCGAGGPQLFALLALSWMAAAGFTAHPKEKTMNMTSLFQMGTQETEKSVLVSQHAFFSPWNSLCEKNSGVFCLWGEDTGVLTRREFRFLTCFTERPIILLWLGGVWVRVDTRWAMGLGMRSSEYPGGKELPWQIWLFEQHQSPDYGRKHEIN